MPASDWDFFKTPPDSSELIALANKLPGIYNETEFPCENCSLSGKRAMLNDIIIHLNDRHRWSRQAIADWIDREQDLGNINTDFKEEV